MHDRRDDRSDRGRRDRDGGDRREGDECRDGGPRRRRGDGSGRDQGGPDTRFLQLEMSKVLYADAESVTKQALRELLLEEAKARFRERFGDQIRGLAQLAVDELMQDIIASLEVEAHIQERNEDRQDRSERLAEILGGYEEDDDPDEEDEGPETE